MKLSKRGWEKQVMARKSNGSLRFINNSRAHSSQRAKKSLIVSCSRQINPVLPVAILTDSEGRYVPFCNFPTKKGIAKKPEICQSKGCEYYRRLHVNLDNGQEVEARWGVSESSLVEGSNGHSTKVRYCGKREARVLLMEPRRDGGDNAYLAFCDIARLPAIPLGDDEVCLGGCCKCYKGLFIGGNGKD